MFEKLEAVEKRYEELTKLIADPEVISNQSEWQKLMKEHASIEDVVLKFREYKKALGDRDNKFILQTFKSLKRRANVRDIEAMIVKYKLNVIGIDQISLMTDVRYQSGDNVKQSYDNISMDLFHLAEKYGVVIILLVQSNREAAKNNEVQLENIADSDDVAQNSSKVISLNRDQNNILTLKVLKNRYGPTGKDVKYIWDIDLGTFKELINDSVEALEGSDELFI